MSKIRYEIETDQKKSENECKKTSKKYEEYKKDGGKLDPEQNWKREREFIVR